MTAERSKSPARKAAERGVYLTAYGIILGACIISASETFQSFAPIPMKATWVQIAGLVVGLALAWTLDDTILTFGGVFIAGLIAIVIFIAAVIGTAAVAGNPFLDVMFIYAFQQSFPHLLGICVFGAVGALLGSITRSWINRSN